MFGLSRPGHRAGIGAPQRFVHASRGAGLNREESIMGTAIAVELWSEERGSRESTIAAVMDEMHRIDRAMSPHKPDPALSRISRDAAAMAVPLSAEMARRVARAAEPAGQGNVDADDRALGRRRRVPDRVE